MRRRWVSSLPSLMLLSLCLACDIPERPKTTTISNPPAFRPSSPKDVKTPEQALGAIITVCRDALQRPCMRSPSRTLPEGKDWLYEVKFDGYRCLAGKRNDGVTLWSRRGNLFTAQFPHIACACERLPADTLLDGEIVAVDESGRISFNLIQHHRSQAQALLFYAFDVLMPGQEPIERTA